MAEAMRRNRVFIEDSRANGLYLRTTWHPEANQFVISTWDDSVCTGAVRIPVEQAATLIGLLADGLRDAAGRPTAPPATRGTVCFTRRSLRRGATGARGRRRRP